MMKRTSEWRSISAVPASILPENRMLTGKSFLTAAHRMRSKPGVLRLIVSLHFAAQTRTSRRKRSSPGADIATQAKPMDTSIGSEVDQNDLLCRLVVVKVGELIHLNGALFNMR